MLGGLAEYGSMLLGFQYLVLVALGFYVLSAVTIKGWRAAARTTPGTPSGAVEVTSISTNLPSEGLARV
jgi:hypothetical protein